MIEPWRKVSSAVQGDFKVFTVRKERRRSPRTGEEHDFFLLDCPNWVNVVALTPRREIIFVEQYRHGSDEVELEIPGGIIDPGDVSPLTAGCRELLEETGYQGRDAQLIGQVHPNPALMGNICYTVLTRNCEMVKAVELDITEDLATVLVPVDDVSELVRSGKIRHSLVVAALYHFSLLREKK